MTRSLFAIAAGVFTAGVSTTTVGADVDAAAAEALARQSGCLKCHSATRDKDGPSYQKVAAKYKGQADAQQKLVAFLSTDSKIKVDGKDDTHKAVASKNEADIKNLVGWILSR